jgi:hypothetical protein
VRRACEHHATWIRTCFPQSADILRRDFMVEGEFFDCCAMALLKDGADVRV